TPRWPPARATAPTAASPRKPVRGVRTPGPEEAAPAGRCGTRRAVGGRGGGRPPGLEAARPEVFLLVGLTGSGKTTYSKRVLEPAGAVRLSVDEIVYARHGRDGIDYPPDAHGGRSG